MTHEDAQPLIHGYMDGELDAVTNQNVEAHLAECQSCRLELASFEALRTGLRGESVYKQAPLTLGSRITGTLPVDVPARKPSSPPLILLWSIAAGFIAAILTGLILQRADVRVPRQPQILAEVVSSHVRSLMAMHLVDVISTDKHTVKPWFDGKLDFAPDVKRLDGVDYVLTGGRLDYIDNRPVAAIVYRHRKHIINLFVWPSPGPNSTMAADSERGYNTEHWRTSGMDYWAVSDVNPDDLQDFSQRVQTSPD